MVKWIGFSLFLILASCSQDGIKQSAMEKPVVVLSAADRTSYENALASIRAKKYSRAEKILDSLIKKYPDAAGPLANRGIIFARQDKADKAEAMFLLALEKNPKLVPARNHLAVLYRKQGKFTSAREMLESAIASDPYYSLAYYNLGILYELYLQQPDKALENYQLYLDLKDGKDKEVSQWVALLRRELGQAK